MTRKLLKMIKKYLTDMNMKTPDNPDLDEPEEIRDYLKANMAEGYLSESEGLNIDRFVDRYEELLQVESNTQEIIKEIQGGNVQ